MLFYKSCDTLHSSFNKADVQNILVDIVLLF